MRARNDSGLLPSGRPRPCQGKDGNAKVMLETKAGKLPVYISFRRGRVDKVYMGRRSPGPWGW